MVGEQELFALGKARADAVQNALLQDGSVDPSRVFIIVQSAEGPLSIQKTVAFGSRADDPSLPAITVDGVITDASSTMARSRRSR